MRVKAYHAAAAFALVALPAQAADLYRSPAPVYTVNQPPNVFSWAGPYIGGNIGGQWGTVTHAVGVRPSGINGGVEAGYNWQYGTWVFGGETDLQVSNADDTFAPWKFSNPWFGTLRGRVGYAADNILFYGTAGLAYGSTRAESLFTSESHVSAGWTAGGGVEFGITRNWSAKAEYLYVHLNDDNFALSALPHGQQFNVLRLGVNYHF
jgi:outer membrane immunogenic protein